MAGMFDDLIPNKAPATGGGMFDDLIPQKEAPSTFGDMAHSFVTGMGKGVMGMAALPGAVTDATRYGVFRLAGMSPEQASATTQGVHQQLSNSPLVPEASNPRDVQAQVEKGTGPLYQPQTTAGQYADTVGQFVPGSALGPGGWVAKGANAVVSGLGSEAAGQYTKGTWMEPYARLIGALMGTGVVAAGDHVLNPKTVDGLNSGAVSRVNDAVNSNPAMSADRLAELGPTATIGDANPTTLQMTRGLYAKPGNWQQDIKSVYDARGAGRSARLVQGTEQSLGPYQSPAINMENVNADIAENVSPQYTAAKQAAPSFDPQSTQQALDGIKGLAYGTTGSQSRAVNGYAAEVQNALEKPTPAEQAFALHNIRKELDGLANPGPMAPSIDKTNAAIMGKIRDQVDGLLKQVPGVSDLDKQVSTAQKALSDRQYGYDSLKGGDMPVSPQQFQAETAAKNMPEVQQGMNAYIRDRMGTSNDMGALKQNFGNENQYNYQKIAHAFGSDAAAQQNAMLNAEKGLQENENFILKGSSTEPTKQATEALATPQYSGLPANATLLGIGSKIAQYPIVSGINRIARAMTAARDADMAKILTMSGQARDEFMQKLANLPPSQRRLLFAISGANGANSAIQNPGNQLSYGPRQ